MLTGRSTFWLLGLVAVTPALAAPRVWLADQGNNQQGAANPNNRILEIDPVNHKNPPDAEGDVIVLRTLSSPADAFLDELTLDHDARLWCVVKNTSDQAQDGATRIDRETGASGLEIFPFIPGHAQGSFLEGIAWDGAGLWITGVRDFSGPAGNVLSRVDPSTGARIAPFNAGTLGTAGRVSIPGNIAQGLLYDPSGGGRLWHSDHQLQKIYQLDITRLFNGDAGNDNDLVVAVFDVPFGPKGMGWMQDKIWVASPHSGIWEFNPVSGAVQKLFDTPQWNLDGLAILPDGPWIALSATNIEGVAYVGAHLPDAEITLSNVGDAPLDFEVTDDAPWLSVAPADGSVPSGQDVALTIQYQLEELPVGMHDAVIWIDSPGASNAPRRIDARITIRPPLADLDGDADVDQSDFGRFQQCLTGSGSAQNDPACQSSRLDSDEDVDGDDFAIFLGCLSGANAQPPPSCYP